MHSYEKYIQVKFNFTTNHVYMIYMMNQICDSVQQFLLKPVKSILKIKQTCIPTPTHAIYIIMI